MASVNKDAKGWRVLFVDSNGTRKTIRLAGIPKMNKARAEEIGRYVDSIVLTDCRFKHATPKQLSEVRTGARQVCQWITGMISEIHPAAVVPVACDPKKSDGFTVDGSRIDSAESVLICSNGCFVSF